MRQPPPRLSAIVGDFVHNLRSALDCLALTLCESGAGRGFDPGWLRTFSKRTQAIEERLAGIGV